MNEDSYTCGDNVEEVMEKGHECLEGGKERVKVMQLYRSNKHAYAYIHTHTYMH